MQEPQATGLIGEAERYLAVVAVFRAEGCEPHWKLENHTQSTAAVGTTYRIAVDGANARRYR